MENIALVLGGGGAKGAYQIGVIIALSQYDLYNKITAFSGTSIGALNMALIQKVNINEAINIWLNKVGGIFFSDNINVYEVMNMLKSIKMNIPLKKSYLSDREKLIELFEELNIEDLAFSDKKMFAACVDMTEIPSEFRGIKAAIGIYEKRPVGKITYLPLNYKSKENLYKTLLASSALPLIYEPIEINKRYYVDGGLIDNLPIRPLYNYGYKDIIIISCDNDISLNKLKFSFPDSNLYLIKPNFDLGNLISGTLNFNKSKIMQSINLGYRDGMNFMKKLIL
ncbi:MAG TPA: hypothetical protein DC000_11510 [Clostridiales bacterium]|nr:hypothetical protein [Clostridiales bacterium]